MTYQYILSETRDNVGLITLNRPKALNALSNDLVTEMAHALDDFEADESIGAIPITIFLTTCLRLRALLYVNKNKYTSLRDGIQIRCN